MVLDRRKQTLLQAIVVHYVQRAEPVGSHFLAAQEALGVRSATIRNELSEMTDLGYLRQPHTSAGRIPSDLGYRYYVDHLMTWDRLSAAHARAIRNAQRLNEGDLEQLLTQTCRVLSSLTRYTSVASPPTTEEAVVRQVHLVQTGPRRLLAVVVLDNGQVVHRFAEVGTDLSPAEVTRLGNVVDGHLRDCSVSRVPSTPPQVDEVAGHEEVLRSVLTAIRRGLSGEESDVLMEGASHILEQPEFRESNRVEPLVRFLEERKTAYETLQNLLSREELTVSIGQENPHESMHEVSVVVARYNAGPRSSGWVGVLGPTRMQYEQAVPAVQYAARVLSETLTRLGFS
jgi:heat-inducible transcriptional repressor